MDVRAIKHAAKLSEWSERIRACRSSGEPVKTWCEENGINIKSYALNQKEYLCTFLDHGEVEISNNQVENAIRPFVVGRKGWLFSDTPEGAEASAVIYSLMETAKANGLRLEDYILHLLSTLPECFDADPDADIDDLPPWNDAVKACFVTL